MPDEMAASVVAGIEAATSLHGRASGEGAVDRHGTTTVVLVLRHKSEISAESPAAEPGTEARASRSAERWFADVRHVKPLRRTDRWARSIPECCETTHRAASQHPRIANMQAEAGGFGPLIGGG
jgi:hypothetical protein